MPEPDPRRRSSPARNPVPQPLGDLQGPYSMPPAVVPAPLPAAATVLNSAAKVPLPPGFPAGIPQPQLPAAYPMPPGAVPQSFPPAQSIPQRPVLPATAFRPLAAPLPSTANATVTVVNGMQTTKAAAIAPAATPAETQPIDFSKVASQFAPPWLISMVVHLLLVMVLALIRLSQVVKPVLLIEASYADTLGEQMLDDSIVSAAMATVENAEPAFSKDVNLVDSPLAAMPKLEILLDAPGSSVNLAAPSIGMALTGREKGAKDALLAAYGGSALTEGSVGMALDWLRKQQNQRDGTWSLTGPYTGDVTIENKTAATAMAMMAFQGNGHSHQKGAHRDPVSKGLKALLKMQDKDGNFVHEGVSGHRLYAQAMASIVVCELYGMTKDPEVKLAAERALSYAAKIQADDGQGGGGWRYHPGQDVDTSVTGWFVMAYQSGRMAGLDSHSQTLQRVTEFLNHVEKVEREFNGSVKDISYFYRINEDPKLSMTAEALLCRQYLGWDRNEPRLQAGVKKLLLPVNRIKWDEPQFYYWYYATQVMHHMGGNEWHAWNQVMRDVLPKSQEKGGRERGSWSPAGDQYGYQGGRLYSTCFCVFMLESYYRHLPIYRHGS